MTIQKTVLLDALKAAASGVGNTPLLQGGDTFVFKDGFIHTYNDAMSVSVPFKAPEPLEGAVKAKEFLAIVGKLPAEEIKLVVVPTHWILKSGNATLELTLLEAAVMDKVKGIAPAGDWLPLPDGLVEGISLCGFTRNTSPLSGVVVSDGAIVSTDEFRINRYLMTQEAITPFWISDPAAQELIKVPSLTDYQVSGAWVNFLSKGGIIFSAKLLNFEKFPFAKLLSVVDRTAQTDEDFSHSLPSGLPVVLDRAATLAMDMEKMTALRLTFEKKGVTVSTERSIGKYKETIGWDEPLSGDPGKLDVILDAGMAAQGFSKSTRFYVKESEVKGVKRQQMVFVGDNFTQIISAVTAPEKKEA